MTVKEAIKVLSEYPEDEDIVTGYALTTLLDHAGLIAWTTWSDDDIRAQLLKAGVPMEAITEEMVCDLGMMISPDVLSDCGTGNSYIADIVQEYIEVQGIEVLDENEEEQDD